MVQKISILVSAKNDITCANETIIKKGECCEIIAIGTYDNKTMVEIKYLSKNNQTRFFGITDINNFLFL